MDQKVIVAEKVMNEVKNVMTYQVAVQVPSGKKYGRKDFMDPLKAMRYMFVMKNKEKVQVSKDSLEFLSKERAAAKTAEVVEQQKAEVAPEPEVQETTKPKRRTRKTKEVAA